VWIFFFFVSIYKAPPCLDDKFRKNLVNKNQGWEPIHQKYKANENTSRHKQSKNKSKQLTKIKLKLYAKRTHYYEMTINNNKEDLKRKSSHLPQIN
jgi:hypothetical protein